MTIDAQKLHNRSRDRNENCLIVAMRVAKDSYKNRNRNGKRNETKRNEISLQYSGGQSQYYAVTL